MSNISLNPFPGLRPFQMEEEYLFFGREQQRQELVTLLREHRFVAVLGASGSGKSSLVRAGLLPALYGGVMTRAGSHWNIALMRPGGNPLRNLTGALLESECWSEMESPPSLLELETTLGRSSLGLIEAVRQARMPNDQNLLVVVDQFEELFRFNQSQSECSTRDQAAALVSLLLEAARQTECSIYVVLTMRSDFFGDCSQFEDLADAINKGEYLVPRLTRDQKRQAIEGPVRVGGAAISSRLIQRLLNDLGEDPDQLPVMQHALMRTWVRWEQAGKHDQPLDVPHYEAIGGMQEALSCHGDEVHAALPSDRLRLVAECVFKALTERGSDNRGVRRPTRCHQLGAIAAADESEVKTVIEAFRRSGRTFLTPTEQVELAPDTVVDISHESLMRVWRRLRHWVEEEAQNARIYLRLAETASLYDEDKAGLYRDPDLQIALSWREQAKPNSIWAERYHPGFEAAMRFLETSGEAKRAAEAQEEEARRRELERAKALAETERQRAEEQVRFAARLKWLIRGLGIVAMVAIAAGAIALFAKQAAQLSEAQAVHAQHRAVQAATELKENLVRTDFATGVELLSAQQVHKGLSYLARALRTDPGYSPAAMRLLSTLTHRSFSLDSRQPLTHEKPIEALELNRAADLVLTFAEGDVARVWDCAAGERVAELGCEDPVQLAGFTSDGSLVVTLSRSNVVRSYRARTGEPTHEALLPGGGIERLLFGPSDPSDTWFATVSVDGHLQAWDARDGTALTKPFELGGRVMRTVFSERRELLAAWLDNGRVRIWETADGSEPLESPITLTGTARARWPIMSFSPDGRLLLVRVNDQPPSPSWVGWYDVRTGQLLNGGRELIAPQVNAGFSADSSRVVWTELHEGALKIHVADARTGDGLKLYEESGPVTRVAVNIPAGKIAAVLEGQRVKVWNLGDNPVAIETPYHEHAITRVALSPEGSRLLTADDEHVVRLWEVSNGRGLTKPMKHSSEVVRVNFSPDGERLLISEQDGVIRLWNSRTGEPLSDPVRLENFLLDRAFARDGSRVALLDGSFLTTGTSRTRTEGQVVLISSRPGQAMWRPLTEPGASTFARWAGQSGKLLMGQRDLSGESWRFSVRAFESDEEGDGFDYPGNIARLNVSGDATRLVITATNRTAVVMDARSGAVLQTLEHDYPVEWAFLSLDGSRVVTVGGWFPVQQLRLWDAIAGERIGASWTHRGRGVEVEFSPDDRVLASGGVDGTLSIVETKTGRVMHDRLDLERNVASIAFSPDGSRLVAGCFLAEARVVDVESGAVVNRFDHEAGVEVDWSPDGRYVLVAGGKNDDRSSELRVYDAHTAQLAGPPCRFDSRVYQAKFVGTNAWVSSITRDGRFAVWDIATGREISEPLVDLVRSSLGSGGDRGIIRFEGGVDSAWSLPAIGGAVPGWVSELAETVAGQRIDARGLPEWVPRSNLNLIRARLREQGGDSVVDNWGRWFLGDRSTRAIAPGANWTLTAYLEALSQGRLSIHLQTVLLHQPTNGLAWARLARATLASSQRREDDGASDTTSRVDPGERSPWRTASEWYSEQATNFSPESAEVWWSRAEVLLRSGKRVEAEQAFERARSILPDHPEVLLVRAELLRNQGRGEEAYQVFAEAFEKRLSDTSSQGDEGGGPLRFLSHLESHAPTNLAAYAEQSVRAKTNQNESRLQLATWVSRYAHHQVPEDSFILSKRGLILERAGKTNEAMAALDEAVAVNPSDLQPLLARANILRERGQTNAALTALTAAIDLYRPERDNDRRDLLIEALQARSECYETLGDAEEALRDYLLAKIPLRTKECQPSQIDLSDYYNRAIYQSLHDRDRNAGNDVGALGTGLIRLNGVVFDVRGVVHLDSSLARARLHLDFPREVRDIAAPGQWARVDFLHGAGFFGAEPEGTQIASYWINYADGQRVEIPVVYGADLRDWWSSSDQRGPVTDPSSVLAWQGPGGNNNFFRVYQKTWVNPDPANHVVSVDITSTMERSAIFVIAITGQPAE